MIDSTITKTLLIRKINSLRNHICFLEKETSSKYKFKEKIIKNNKEKIIESSKKKIDELIKLLGFIPELDVEEITVPVIKSTKLVPPPLAGEKPSRDFLENMRNTDKYLNISFSFRDTIWVVTVTRNQIYKHVGSSNDILEAIAIRDKYLATL